MLFEWLVNTKPVMDAALLKDAVRKIIAAYGQFLETNPVGSLIIKTSRLPYDKEKILAALCFELATGDYPAVRRMSLVCCAQLLAYCQTGVVDPDLDPLGVAIARLSTPSMGGGNIQDMQADVARLNRRVSEPITDASTMTEQNIATLLLTRLGGDPKHDGLRRLIKADTARIGRQTEKANRLWLKSRQKMARIYSSAISK